MIILKQSPSFQKAHKPVLVQEVITHLAIKPGGIYLDVTFGCGGHTEQILEAEPTCKVIGIDWDKEALDIYGQALKEKYGERLTLIWGSFGHLHKLLKT
ncbi:MAG TPA: 16S rRNA (cytosine(1402)-N(4))-methyltransferase, partial [Candidatus Babeliales bacterium]|nr:16S rRNA (cytosine(1402)-N(4))-methyltransferase [Candidatus Babeliales bacterium]